jgi:peptidoglycan hydrolase CwlO-like protein
MEHHSEWQTEIRKRSANLESDWWPFVQNVEDICGRIDQLNQKIDDLSNEIGETKGMVRNLRKVLIKLEIVDDRFIF